MQNAPSHFQIIPDFNAQSAKPVCYISKLPKQARRTPQQQDHEIDEFILRGPEIDFEGYMDLRPAVIIETAREVFEMISKDEADALRQEAGDISYALQLEKERADNAEKALEALLLVVTERDLPEGEDLYNMVDLLSLDELQLAELEETE